MIIKQLFIRNYRCFGEIPVIVKFSETGLGVFVGANNAGKSTALKALEILLGDKWPMGQISEDDFHGQDYSKKIILACEFGEPITCSIYNKSAQVVGVYLEATYAVAGYGQFSTNINYHLITSISDFKTGDWSLYSAYGGKPANISSDTKSQLPLTITVPLIKLYAEQPTNKWGVLGRMLQKIENTFSSDTDKVDRFKNEIRKAVGILREPTEFTELETNIIEFWNKIRPKNLTGTSLNFLDYDPWHYYRQFRLAIKKATKDVPLDSLGEGVQRLAVLALYRAYLKSHSRNQKAVLLIEEPESYLHPQARSVVYNVLREAIHGEDMEGQIIYTTHSSDFIDCAFFQEIAIFSERQDGSGSLVRQADKQQMQFQTQTLLGIAIVDQIDPTIYYRLVETDSLRLKDALFGSKAIIVEGSSDFEFFKYFGKTDSEQISVVIAGGKNNIPSLYSFLTAFGIPTLICADQDSRNGRLENLALANLINNENVNEFSNPTELALGKDIDAVKPGLVYKKRNLLIFATKLEDFIKSQIPDYENLILNLKNKLNLKDSKPKLIFAVSLCIEDKMDSIVLSKKQQKAFKAIGASVKRFLSEEIPIPKLATPPGTTSRPVPF